MTAAVEGLKIDVGTKIDDVYGDKQAFEQARLADKNGDHVIDKDELSRFVGPVFVENVTTKEGRIEGSVASPLGSRRLSAVLLKDSEIDYYPGLTLDKVKGSRELKTFSDIDIDGTQSLSSKEIRLYGKKREIKNLKDNKNRVLENYQSAKKTFQIFGGVSVGSMIGAFALTAIGLITLPEVLFFAGTVAGIGAAITGVDALCERKTAKNTEAECDKQLKELEPQVEKETAEILGKTKEVK